MFVRGQGEKLGELSRRDQLLEETGGGVFGQRVELVLVLRERDLVLELLRAVDFRALDVTNCLLKYLRLQSMNAFCEPQ